MPRPAPTVPLVAVVAALLAGCGSREDRLPVISRGELLDLEGRLRPGKLTVLEFFAPW